MEELKNSKIPAKKVPGVASHIQKLDKGKNTSIIDKSAETSAQTNKTNVENEVRTLEIMKSIQDTVIKTRSKID